MTNDQICEALAAVGAAAYVDVIYGGYVVLDGTFDLQQLVAIGDVARKALVEPKVGDTIRATATSKPFYEVGDYARLLKDCGDFWEADFNDSRNATVEGQGFWAIGSERFEVVR